MIGDHHLVYLISMLHDLQGNGHRVAKRTLSEAKTSSCILGVDALIHKEDVLRVARSIVINLKPPLYKGVYII